MPDVDVLRGLTGQFQRPGFDDLVSVSRQRRRRSVLGAAAGVSIAVLAVGLAAAGLSDGRRALEPAPPPPSPTGSPASGEEWPPERVRAEGSPLGPAFDARLGPAPAGLGAELYCIGGEGCDDFPPDLPGRTSHFALEMTQGDRSALFEVQGRPWATYFGTSILVQDGFGQARRFRLLSADGTAMPVDVVSAPAPAAPGPDVVLVQDLDRARDFQVGPEGPGVEPYLVDDGAGTLQPLDVPEEVKDWGPNVEEFLWGTNDCRAVWQRPDGVFDNHDIGCRDPALTRLPVDYWTYLADWAEPGRMVLLEHDENGVPLTVHASLDRGATWQRAEVERRSSWNGTLAEAAVVISAALDELE